ncbi:hypothetical protein EYF80_047516 [Liparis tanakae]|uniref:Uncharacterized protein n=1 Tax=Liparis tanakae TaxID=230148 RepID=A0A4Z2FNF8_9TELE|nr:hypothetical protein EYF80_047516 [Liparis tanakae]
MKWWQQEEGGEKRPSKNKHLSCDTSVGRRQRRADAAFVFHPRNVGVLTDRFALFPPRGERRARRRAGDGGREEEWAESQQWAESTVPDYSRIYSRDDLHTTSQTAGSSFTEHHLLVFNGDKSL